MKLSFKDFRADFLEEDWFHNGGIAFLKFRSGPSAIRTFDHLYSAIAVILHRTQARICTGFQTAIKSKDPTVFAIDSKGAAEIEITVAKTILRAVHNSKVSILISPDVRPLEAASF
jgi:hypothetical protein